MRVFPLSRSGAKPDLFGFVPPARVLSTLFPLVANSSRQANGRLCPAITLLSRSISIGALKVESPGAVGDLPDLLLAMAPRVRGIRL
jgi:hypothetical protein